MARQRNHVVTITVGALERAFRKAFPDKSAQELYPLWLQFYAAIHRDGTVEPPKPKPVEAPVEVPPEADLLTDDPL